MPFNSFGLHPDLVRGVKDLGFSQPTAIQKDAIPAAIAGRDVLACSATGSGKTAAFVLPILNLLAGKPRGTTRALILTPTRELAHQIEEHIALLAKHSKVSSASVYGGVGMGPQRQAFQHGVDIIVATPGRLLDHLSYSYAKLSKIEVLVLDEADRMLDMGFLPDIRKIMQCIPKQRQTLFFSATMPREIVTLTRELLNNPATINLERQSKPAEGIRQSIYPVPHLLKSALLVKLLKDGGIKNALVFTRTKRRADRVADYLKRAGVSAARIHGDRTQAQRTQAMNDFKRGRHQVLVATDVAARGIDVDALSHVINLDLPGSPEDYIHRIGRTARAEATGDAYTFVAPEEERDLRLIERTLSTKLPRVIQPEFDYTAVPPESDQQRRRPSGGGHRQYGNSNGQRGNYSERNGNTNEQPRGNREPGRHNAPWRNKPRQESSGSARPWEQSTWQPRRSARPAAASKAY